MATTPSTPARSNHGRALSLSRSSSFGTSVYAATPTGPRAVISRFNASSAETRRLSSVVMTSAATFLPAKLSGPAPGAFHVDLNLYDAPDTIDGATLYKMATSNAGTAHFFINPPKRCQDPPQEIKRTEDFTSLKIKRSEFPA